MQEHTEPTGDALGRAAQAIAVTVTVTEAIALLRAQRATNSANDAEQQARLDQLERRLREEQLRLTWEPALRADVRKMSASEALNAWAAAHQDGGILARQAARAVEERLRVVHPEAMTAYEQAVRDGAHPLTAMQQATKSFRGEYGLDEAGTGLGHVADHLDHAAEASTRPDDPQSSGIDQHAISPVALTVTTGPAATCPTDAGALHTAAYPMQIREAMVSAPSAARAALPPVPARRAIAASPSLPR